MKSSDSKEFIKLLRIEKIRDHKVYKFLLRLCKIYNTQKYDLDTGIEFINRVINKFRIKYTYNNDELKNIPRQGSFITVSNHPLGAIDELLLIKIISHLRSDFKIITHSLLCNIEPIKKYLLPLNIFTGSRYNRRSERFTNLKDSLQHLRNGSPIGIFPAGEISSYNPDSNRVTDREWQTEALKFIKKANVPVVPIYFHTNDNRLYHLLKFLPYFWRNIKFPSKFFTKSKGKIIQIRIGKPIPVKDQEDFKDISHYGCFLRAKTYSLNSNIEVKKFFKYSLFKLPKEEKIIPAVDKHLIEKEIKYLHSQGHYHLYRNRNYDVYCAPAIEIPYILNEIGRLREITFREIGEGTNKSIDIDEFDLYYYHLFIWDNEKKRIVGAYRVGKGKEILLNYGKRGFYINTLFRISNEFLYILSQALELGRSFIVKEYQKKALSLYLLWKGILYFLLKHPEYRYLIGPVSISSKISDTSRNLIMEFIKSNHYNYILAQYIKPRKKFKVSCDLDTNIFLEKASNDLNKLDKLIANIEFGNYNVPVLLKKYIQLNADIIGFNLDPKFNNALDGLIILDIYNVPSRVIESLSKDLNDRTILERFFENENSNIFDKQAV